MMNVHVLIKFKVTIACNKKTPTGTSTDLIISYCAGTAVSEGN